MQDKLTCRLTSFWRELKSKVNGRSNLVLFSFYCPQLILLPDHRSKTTVIHLSSSGKHFSNYFSMARFRFSGSTFLKHNICSILSFILAHYVPPSLIVNRLKLRFWQTIRQLLIFRHGSPGWTLSQLVSPSLAP